MCGGTLSVRLVLSLFFGLSPRVRGHLIQYVVIVRCLRSIPACAGAPTSKRNSALFGRVYPRVCGGTGPVVGQSLIVIGLSPRVRGHRWLASPSLPPSGSIPACAGAPSTTFACGRRATVYPRVCGGTLNRVARQCQIQGLSPRVRGHLRRSHEPRRQ